MPVSCPAKVVQYLKERSFRLMQEEFPELKERVSAAKETRRL
jgi:REP element-mobilizing transposase RayT